jgi:hypothetical protein
MSRSATYEFVLSEPFDGRAARSSAAERLTVEG